jgi:hypothetical protein
MVKEGVLVLYGPSLGLQADVHSGVEVAPLKTVTVEFLAVHWKRSRRLKA